MKIKDFIRKQLRKWDKNGYSPFSINCGNCDSFAQELEEKFPKGVAIWGDERPDLFKTDVDVEGHCFFKYGKKFYDSESPEGVDCPDKLNYYRRDLIEYQEYWAKEKTA